MECFVVIAAAGASVWVNIVKNHDESDVHVRLRFDEGRKRRFPSEYRQNA